MRRLEALEKHRLDLSAVLDLVPLVASEVFAPGGALRELALSHVQRRLLVGVGFLGRSLASAALELGLEAGAGYNQAGALLTKSLGRAYAALVELRAKGSGSAAPGGSAPAEPAEVGGSVGPSLARAAPQKPSERADPRGRDAAAAAGQAGRAGERKEGGDRRPRRGKQRL